MNEGFESMRLGLGGMPAAAEDIMVARDIRLAEITGGRLHIQHISTARSVELVREGQRRGVRVTAEACPHHFTLTDEKLRTFDSNFKMNPPLRTWSDVEAVIGGLKDGTIEILATDHAPACAGKEDARDRPGPVRHRRPGDLDPDHGDELDRARPSDLARGDAQADDQRRAASGDSQGDTARRRRCRRHDHRPGRVAGRSTRRSFGPRATTRRSAAGRFAAGPTPSSWRARFALREAGSFSSVARRCMLEYHRASRLGDVRS